ncbi:MAG: UvrD-helicase domain-containing protein [Solirubrobacteraceae bacterium]
MTETFESLAFDLTGPLPRGISVLEASAGTGKTYTIAALAARYVAEGTTLERLLIITFTRMATGELRERVRDRLLKVRVGLEQMIAGVVPADRDEVLDRYAGEPAETLRLRCDRLEHAIAEFDAATITTTHGFCQEVLVGLGIAADLEPDVTFVEDLSDLTDDVIDDLYVRRFHRDDKGRLPFTQAGAIARAAIDQPAARIVAPVPTFGDGDAVLMRGRLAQAARDEFERRKRASAVMTFDDLLTRLNAALEGPGGDVTAARLRQRYDVVLVDEFQDTDPVQWEIMRLAFGHDQGTLVLIADPKQAIYAFRGADVYSYLAAAHAAGSRATLRINWRSDQGLLDAYDALFEGTRLGHEGIAYRTVKAAPPGASPRLLGGAGGSASTPLRLRIVRRDSVEQTQYGYAVKGSARAHIARDVAEQVVELLSSGASIERRSESGELRDSAPVRPGDIAVLVPTNRQAAQIRTALEQAGVPAVINGAGSVFETEPAGDWLRLLEALERPGSAARAHSAALTCFVGWSAEQLAMASEEELEGVHQRLHDWARVLRSSGVAALLELIAARERLPARVLSESDGERRLTDLRHLGQLLHAEAQAEQLGTTALTAWLRRRIAEASEDTGNELRSRRLESDSEAVQVLTIHRSKGLEFGIVMLPFLWEPGYIPDGANPVFFHDPDAGDVLTIDVALEGQEYDRHRSQHVIERRGEDLRLAYVALTRARHQAIVWWAGSYDARDSPLGRLLFFRDPDGNVAASGGRTPEDGAVRERFEQLAAIAPGSISVEDSLLGMPSSWSEPLPDPVTLAAARFDRGLDLRWRRTSYSDITSGAHEQHVSSETEEPLLGDEPDEEAPIPAVADELARPELAAELALPSPLAALPFGVQIGTFVHNVLERTDFAAALIDLELERSITAISGFRAVEIGEVSVLRDGLHGVLETPLGPVFGDARLCDVSRGDRLDELAFELPLAGGDDPRGWVTLERVASVLRSRVDASDPLSGYAERLSDPALRQQFRGYLTGSLDLVARLPGDRFAIVDYKTNWLGAPDEPLTVGHYRPAVLAAEMQRRHYCLQALLYLVALHRFLRWRVPGYDPERQLAGAVYLFLRGMLGVDTPVVDGARCGVFAWSPPAGLVVELSDALDGYSR